MTDETPRGLTPAVRLVSPMYDFFGTLYPYINMKSSGFTPYIDAFKRSISSVNPFALQQVPTSDSISFGRKYGESFYRAPEYPSYLVLDTHFPSHYDPLKDPKYLPPPGSLVLKGTPGITLQKFPTHCTRQVDFFKRCLIANDDDKQKCSPESENILAICPPWALDKMREATYLQKKLEALANKTYRQVMEVPEYNKGRTVADVPLKTWSDGERDRLRPDSLWNDERYIDITQKEINEAKERIRKRNAAKGYKPDTSIHQHTYDRTYEAPSTKIPLY